MSSSTSNSASTSVSPSQASPSSGPVRAKRKQNQSCDTCKTRKIKCDLLLLPPSSTCTNCSSKGIICTTKKIANKVPPRRTGVRIEAARQSQGIQSTSSSSSSSPSDSQPSHASTSSQVAVRATPPRLLEASGDLPAAVLSHATEQELIERYLDASHFGVLSVDTASFKRRWDEAGRDTSLLSPVEMVLCSMMAAWGFRYAASTSPHLLSTSSPQALERAASELFSKSLALLDKHGILRKPSLKSIEAIALMAPMADFQAEVEDGKSVEARRNASYEAKMLAGVLFEQVETLGIWDAREGSLEEKRSNQRLLWIVWMGDCFQSASRRKAPRFAEGAIYSIFPYLPRPRDPLPSTDNLTPGQCCLLLSIAFPAMGDWVLRYSATHVVVPSTNLMRPQTFEELETGCLELWSRARTLVAWVESVALKVAQLPTFLSFTPIGYFLSSRMAHAVGLLFAHRIVRERLTAEILEAQRVGCGPSAFIEPSCSCPSSCTSSLFSPTLELYTESVQVSLAASRSFARAVKEIVPNSFITCGGSELRELVLIAEHLAETPTVEQGFIDRGTGPTEWNWESKMAEIRWVIEGMDQTAWVLGITSRVRKDVLDIMARMTPAGLPPFDVDASPPSPNLPNHQTPSGSPRTAQDELFRVITAAQIFNPPPPTLKRSVPSTPFTNTTIFDASFPSYSSDASPQPQPQPQPSSLSSSSPRRIPGRFWDTTTPLFTERWPSSVGSS